MLLFLGVLMLAAKPFVGFSIIDRIKSESEENILVKSFTKRKQEFVDGSEFDILSIQQRLNKPATNLLLLFWGFLSTFFPPVGKVKAISSQLLSAINMALSWPRQRYLLQGRLII